MAAIPDGEITLLLARVAAGDREAESRLAELVYEELHRRAQEYMRFEKPDVTLQPTILVHDAFMQLVDRTHPNWQNRSHFYAAAALAMRHILVDHVRSRRSAKRGGGRFKVEFEDALCFTDQKSDEVWALNEAIDRLAELDRRQARVVELRYFGGLTEDEIAGILRVSTRTVKREWETAKLWLRRELKR